MVTTNSPAESNAKAIITLCIGALLVLLSFTLPAVGMFTREMVSLICVLAFGILFWLAKPIPIIATSFLVIVLLPLLSLTPSLNAALGGFTNPANYFVIASFAFALALQKTTLSNRLLKTLISFSKGNYKTIALVFMLITYVISAFISDIATAVLMIAFALELGEFIQPQAEKRRLLKVLLIGIPIASLLGGSATPVGSAVNVMALNVMQQHGGQEVSFLSWMAVALPVSLATLFACWHLLTRIHKAAHIPQEQLLDFMRSIDTALQEKKTRNEKRILAVLALIVITWVVSSWVPALNATTVSLIGMAVLFLPGIKAFTWGEFRNYMAWEIPIMGAALITLGSLLVDCGLVDLVIQAAIYAFPNMGIMGFVLLLGVLVTALLTVMPVGPAMVSMMTIPAYIMAETLGFNPVMAVLVVGIFASNSTILPLKAVLLVSYTKGYWKPLDLIPLGIMTSVVWIALAALWIPLISPIAL